MFFSHLVSRLSDRPCHLIAIGSDEEHSMWKYMHQVFANAAFVTCRQRRPQTGQRRREVVHHTLCHLRRAVQRQWPVSWHHQLRRRRWPLPRQGARRWSAGVRTAPQVPRTATAAGQRHCGMCAMDEQQLWIHQPCPKAVHAVEAAASPRADRDAAWAGYRPVCGGRPHDLWPWRVNADTAVCQAPDHRWLLEADDSRPAPQGQWGLLPADAVPFVDIDGRHSTGANDILWQKETPPAQTPACQEINNTAKEASHRCLQRRWLQVTGTGYLWLTKCLSLRLSLNCWSVFSAFSVYFNVFLVSCCTGLKKTYCRPIIKAVISAVISLSVMLWFALCQLFLLHCPYWAAGAVLRNPLCTAVLAVPAEGDGMLGPL